MIKDWLFYKGALKNGAQRDLDLSAFTSVALPHTWNAVDGQDGVSGGTNGKKTDYYRGDGWYRAWVGLLVTDADKRQFLRFQGVNMQCDVYMNEKLVGSHKGGYTAFCLDISPYLHFGADNLLAVRVNNAFCADIAPLTADFTFYGGIYRQVELLQRESVSFCITKNGAKALQVTTPTVTAQQAVCQLEALVENTEKVEKTVTITGEFGTYSSEKELVLSAESSETVQFTFQVPYPHLWNGREDPYLYTARLLLVEEGQKKDEVCDRIGLRFFHVDREKGFYLNGRSYPLRGISRHQDREGKGNALTNAEHDEDFEILYDLGATAVRLAHYPHAEYFYQLCDQKGILVWAEIPFVDKMGGTGSFESPDAERAAFFSVTQQQLTELIVQNQNHPSIFCWGLQNEVRAKFDQEMIPFMEDLHRLAKELDPSRLTTQATNQKTAYHWKSDLLAWNVYPGWYGMRCTQLGLFLDGNRCERPMGLSEYGAGGNHLQHERRPRKPRHNGDWHPEEYQTRCHEAFLRQIEKRDWLWGTFVWNLFDFGSDGRNEGDRPGMNDKGLVSFDRRVKKDAYYFYQSSWSKLPTLHIAQSRFINRSHKKTDFKVYSNLEQVELYHNGKKIGVKQQSQNKQRCIFVWKNKRLHPGENQIKAVARQGETVLTQETVFLYTKGKGAD